MTLWSNNRETQLTVKHCKVTGEEKYVTITVPIYAAEKFLIDNEYGFNAVEGIWYKYD